MIDHWLPRNKSFKKHSIFHGHFFNIFIFFLFGRLIHASWILINFIIVFRRRGPFFHLFFLIFFSWSSPSIKDYYNSNSIFFLTIFLNLSWKFAPLFFIFFFLLLPSHNIINKKRKKSAGKRERKLKKSEVLSLMFSSAANYFFIHIILWLPRKRTSLKGYWRTRTWNPSVS